MARLFITPREIDFISDITKEVIKDVIGQRIYYFSINEAKTNVHDVYMEAPEKVFETPIMLDALVEYEPEGIFTNVFGSEEMFDIKAWVHYRDTLDKGVVLAQGDFFSFGEIFFEITKLQISEIVYGQTEHAVGYEILGKQSRKGQFVSKVFGPTDEAFSDGDAVQDLFVQQRGAESNRLGPTGDVRDLQKKGVLERPLTGPREVSPRGSDSSAGSAFYSDDGDT